MKNQFKSIFNSSILIIIIIFIMLYFGYEIIKPILGFVNTEFEGVDNIRIIKEFFQIT